jgi:hypothetical protein
MGMMLPIFDEEIAYMMLNCSRWRLSPEMAVLQSFMMKRPELER